MIGATKLDSALQAWLDRLAAIVDAHEMFPDARKLNEVMVGVAERVCAAVAAKQATVQISAGGPQSGA
jgi:hypothetical protein